jgi:hypothetical protein
MYSKDIYVLLDLLGNDPRAESIRFALSRNAISAEVALSMLRNLAREKGWDPHDLPKFSLPSDLPPSDYVVGTAVSGTVKGQDVGPSEKDLPSHTGVFGSTNAGKTVLVMLLVLAFIRTLTASGRKRRVYVWDANNEYFRMMPFFAHGECVVVNDEDICLNPFEIPTDENGRPVMSPEKWIGNLRTWMRLFWLNEPSCNLFCEILRQEYRKRESFRKKTMSNYPTLSDMIEALEQLNVQRGSDRERARGKLLDRLKSLRDLLPSLDVAVSRDFRKLMNRSVIFDISRLRDTARPVLFSLFTTWYRETFWSEEPAEIDKMLVIEEAHEPLSGKIDARTSDLKEGNASGLLRDLRKTSTSGTVVSQLIKDVSESILGNLGTVFSLRQSHGRCIDQVTSALNLKPWQKSEAGTLPDRRAICRLSRYGSPICVQAKDASFLFSGSRRITREQARQLSRPIIDSVPYVKRVNTAKPGPDAKGKVSPAGTGGLSPVEMEVFCRIAEYPWELIADRLIALGMDRDSESRVRGTVESLKLLAYVGRVGAKNRLWELTDHGKAVARALGLHVEESTGKGGLIHWSIENYTLKSVKASFPNIVLQREKSSQLPGLQPDITGRFPDGRRIVGQACCRNAPADEASAFLRLCGFAQGVTQNVHRVAAVLGVCVNKGHRKAVEEAVRRVNGGRMPGSLVLVDFDSMMRVDFDWKDELDGLL